jgi:hypothetical protein
MNIKRSCENNKCFEPITSKYNNNNRNWFDSNMVIEGILYHFVASCKIDPFHESACNSGSRSRPYRACEKFIHPSKITCGLFVIWFFLQDWIGSRMLNFYKGPWVIQESNPEPLEHGSAIRALFTLFYMAWTLFLRSICIFFFELKSHCIWWNPSWRNLHSQRFFRFEK